MAEADSPESEVMMGANGKHKRFGTRRRLLSTAERLLLLDRWEGSTRCATSAYMLPEEAGSDRRPVRRNRERRRGCHTRFTLRSRREPDTRITWEDGALRYGELDADGQTVDGALAARGACA